MGVPDRHVTVGEIRGVHGVRGWVKLFSYTSPKENLLDYKRFESPTGQMLEVLEGRKHGKTLIARLDGVEDRDAALALNGTELRVTRSSMPEPEDDEYYWSDLLGLAVYDQTDRLLGAVDYLLETGAHDVLVIRSADGTETLVPFVIGHTVMDVDLDAKRIRVEWMDGDDDADDRLD